MIQPNSDLPKKRGGGGEEGRLGKNVEGLLTIKKKKEAECGDILQDTVRDENCCARPHFN